MIAYLCKRLAWAFLVLLGITGIVFVVVHLSGDPAALYMSPEGTKEDYQLLRSALGFDRPLPEGDRIRGAALQARGQGQDVERLTGDHRIGGPIGLI